MKILILGASGFIGKSIYKSLKNSSHEVIPSNSKYINFSNLKHSKELLKKLENIDIVINSIGIIAETKTKTFEQIHTLSPIVLFDASKKAGVKKIIQISALGSQNGTTNYHISKHRADEHLKSLGLDYAILYPSIVYGDDGKSTALFQGLASLPIAPLVKDGSQLLQPIRIEDLVNIVKKSIDSKSSKIELNVVGSEPISYKVLLQTFRKWLGYTPSKSLSIPSIGIDTVGKILDEPTINNDSIIMLNAGNSADVEPLTKFLGYTPISIQKNLAQKEAYNSQKLYASLYLLRPLLKLIIGLVWIWSGIVSAFLYPLPLALELLHDVGISSPLDIPLLYVASFLDIIIGIMTIIGYRLQLMLKFQILVIIIYTLLLTLFAPHHWLHPFGPILKNIPLVFTIYILSRLEKFR